MLSLIKCKVFLEILLLDMINEAAQRMTGCFIRSKQHADK